MEVLTFQVTEGEFLDDRKKNDSIILIGKYIQAGAKEFLMQEYKFLSYFMTFFALIIFLAVDVFGHDEP